MTFDLVLQLNRCCETSLVGWSTELDSTEVTFLPFGSWKEVVVVLVVGNVVSSTMVVCASVVGAAVVSAAVV